MKIIDKVQLATAIIMDLVWGKVINMRTVFYNFVCLQIDIYFMNTCLRERFCLRYVFIIVPNLVALVIYTTVKWPRYHVINLLLKNMNPLFTPVHVC